ncbi:hypothetical protein [Dyadobacter beijingensis]|uniref:hypothetical protein n=1 Tax=Dyadobacter beijingensis TaxID=365489 RepID=UPI0012FB0042|nr:hypothetical protein [Dyadobacter beijingensis]
MRIITAREFRGKHKDLLFLHKSCITTINNARVPSQPSAGSISLITGCCLRGGAAFDYL